MMRIQNAIVSLGGLALLVGALVALNQDMRRHVENILTGNGSELTAITAPVNRAGRVVFQTLNDYRTDEGPMFAFALAAIVLVGFMWKT
jgi:hypothetical protein